MIDMNFSDMIAINKYKIVDECATHASNYHLIAEEYANKKVELDSLQDNLKLTLAEEEMRIRTNWADTDGKMTESSVAAKLILSLKVKEAKEAIRDKQKEVNILDAAKDAMEHRKHNLDNLVSLLIGGFYSTPDGGRKQTPASSIEADYRHQRREKDDQE